MPLWLQVLVLSDLVGEEKAGLWAELLTGEPFICKLNGEVKYRCGQPMGAYSSWPMMALTHHYIISYAAERVNINPRGKYVILGDDVVIFDAILARSYKEVMASLDVPISSEKTHVSKDTCEFAKRWMWRGTEISPLPLEAFVETVGRYHLLAGTIEDAKRRGYEPKAGWTEALTELLTRLRVEGSHSSSLALLEVFQQLGVSKKVPDQGKGVLFKILHLFRGKEPE